MSSCINLLIKNETIINEKEMSRHWLLLLRVLTSNIEDETEFSLVKCVVL